MKNKSIIMYNILDIWKLDAYNKNMKTNPLKIARITKGLSQSELADKVGVTRQTIVSIESGSYNPTLHLCIKICVVLDKTLDELFWDESILPKEN